VYLASTNFSGDKEMLMPEAAPTPPQGLIVDLVTPLHPDLSLDEESLGRLVERVVSPADGILAGSPDVGEALDLPDPLRRQLLAALLTTVRGRVPLFFGITGSSPEATRELALAVEEDCRRRGYRGAVYLVDLPLWYHSNRGLPQACQRLLEEVHRPLVLLNLPELIKRRAPWFKRRNIRTQVFKKLAAFSGVTGLIHQGEMRRFLHYHGAAALRPGFAFYEADEENFLSRPGAWGVISPGAQLFPAFWSLVTRVCLHPEEAAQDPELRLETWNLSQRLQKLSRAYRSQPAALLKSALATRGLLSSAALAPGTEPVLPAQRQELLALLAALDQTP
jgi:dihydrodipicolinate synthase/N-acetylneuraminate lyase